MRETSSLEEVLNGPPLDQNQCSALEERIAEVESTIPSSPIFFPGDTPQPGRCFANIADALFMTLNGGVPTSIFDTDVVPGTGRRPGKSTAFEFKASGFALGPHRTDNRWPAYGSSNSIHSDYFALIDQPKQSEMSFRLDLGQLIQQAHNAKVSTINNALGVQGLTGPIKGGPIVDPSVNVWLSGRYIDFDNDQANADLDGHVAWLTAGAGFRVSSAVTIGVLGRLRTGEAKSTAIPAALDSNMYGGGVYTIVELWGDALLRTGVLYEYGDNDIRIQRDTDSKFDSDLWTFEAILDKRFWAGHVWFEPGLQVNYYRASRDGYVQTCLSCRGIVPSGDLSLGRLTYGSRVGTTISGGISGVASVESHASVKGLWDFDNEDDFSAGTLNSPGGVYSSATHGIDLGAGVNVAFIGGAVAAFSGNYFLFDNDLQGWYVSGGFGVPF